MPLAAFEYSAFNEQGKKHKGILQADTAKQARQQLREQGLFVVSIALIATQQDKTSVNQRFFQRVSSDDVVLFTRQLETLLSAGIPIADALQSVALQTSAVSMRKIIMAVRAKVLEGHALAVALSEFPSVFPPLYRATIKAGESAGHVDSVLARLADYVERQQAIRKKIQQAMIYPTIMLMVSLAIVIFLLSTLVPQITVLFADSNSQLPFVTELLIAISESVTHYGIYAAIAIVIAVFLFARAYRHKPFRARVHNYLLRLPLIGKLIRLINTSRYCRTVAILSQAGVPIVDAMQLATEVVNNNPMQASLQQAAEKVREGVSINQALSASGYLPAVSLHLIANGESSGRLEAMLNRAADSQETATAQAINTMVSLLEPLMTLFMGGVVLFIVLAILLPIFNLSQLV